MEAEMKSVYAITEKSKEGRTRPKHVLFGIDKNDLDSAKMFTEARQKINWDNTTWGLFCTEETYEYIKKHLIFSGFDPYEIPETTAIHLEEMKDMHFYKEIVML
jgi:hypothetical protein